MSDENTTPPEDEPVESTEVASTETTDSSHRAADRIGSYRLLQRIGEGGMGEVWLAEQQEPIRRRVALKLIKFGMDTKQVVARFEAERQALALMNHPNIAKVFDAGATEQGRPYFVMEYVKGEPITKYCDRQRLTNQERLSLFTQVCEGVQHAHQKAIIHRDIKPSNVLVQVEGDQAVPKIIDFGVAKATEHRLTEKTLFTQMGALIGTPEYMSPEQAEMTGLDIDTRTDVYSLGVLLYELLVGALPFDPHELRKAGFDEIRRKIREDEPSKPSKRLNTLGDESTDSARKRRTNPTALAKQLRGDLDWITMKTLEKDRTRRYASASELAADINRHLQLRPVLAGPPSATYQLRRFLVRHKIKVRVAVAFLLLASISYRYAAFESHSADKARASAMRMQITNVQLSKVLVGTFRNAEGLDIASARRLLAQGLETSRKEFADSPYIYSEMLQTFGRIYAALGFYDEALELLDRGSNVQHNEIRWTPSSSVAGLAFELGLQERTNRIKEAVLRKELPSEHQAVAAKLTRLALGLNTWFRSDEARPVFQLALRIQEKGMSEDPVEFADSYYILACISARQGQIESAVGALQRALDVGFADPEIVDNPDLVSLHDVPEFEAIVAEVKRRIGEE